MLLFLQIHVVFFWNATEMRFAFAALSTHLNDLVVCSVDGFTRQFEFVSFSLNLGRTTVLCSNSVSFVALKCVSITMVPLFA